MAPQESPEEQGDKGFTISDKRLFTREGARRTPPSAAETPGASPPPPPRQEPPRAEVPRRPRPEAGEPQRHDMPSVDFATFVAMLANNVVMLLGQVPDPDLPQAKHTIDILLMLRDKTRGNLSAEEAQLMQELLPQLQMAYVAASRQVG